MEAWPRAQREKRMGSWGLWGYRQEGGLRGGRDGGYGSSRLTKKLWVQPGDVAHSQHMGQARALFECDPEYGCFQPGP